MTDFLVPGAGTPAMIFRLSQRLTSTKYDLAILSGICGSYRSVYTSGTTLRVEQDRFADLGAGSPEGFLPAGTLGLYPPADSWMAGWMDDNPGPAVDCLQEITAVKGITLNTVSGTVDSIQAMRERYDPDVESMEGAAFFYVCKQQNLNFVQLRTVSNLVEPRNRDHWEINMALTRMARQLERLITELHG